MNEEEPPGLTPAVTGDRIPPPINFLKPNLTGHAAASEALDIHKHRAYSS